VVVVVVGVVVVVVAAVVVVYIYPLFSGPAAPYLSWIDITIAHYSEFFCHSERKKNFRIINSSQDAVLQLTKTVALQKDSESRFRLEQ
jgi:hypothetical protein